MSAVQSSREKGPGSASEVDVLVAGAGACGLIAAIRAAKGGVRVALVEKLDRFAGDTTLSTGTIPAAGTQLQRESGIRDSVESMVADIERVTGPHEASHLTRMLAQRSAEVVQWLIDECGIRFKLYTNYRHIGHTIARLHLQPSGRGVDLVKDLAAAAHSNGIEIAFSTPVRQLLIGDDGKLIGAELDGPQGQYRIKAKKIILATGGFGANAELLRQYCPDIAGAPFFGGPGSEGEAIKWGRALGARLANIGAYQAHGSVAFPQRHLLTWSAAEKGAFYVNREGRRFGNESIGYAGFGVQVLAQGNEAYAIYDKRIQDYIGEHLESYKDLVARGGAQQAATVEGLAAHHGLDAANLAQTLAAYDRSARGQAPDPFGRSDFGMAPLEPPYVITRVQACLFHTQGGLMVDTRARVMHASGEPIPNLFAGGGAATCISGRAGGTGYVSGNGLLSASVLGYVAAETALDELKQEKP